MPIIPLSFFQSSRALIIGIAGFLMGIGVIVGIVLLSDRGVNIDESNLLVGRPLALEEQIADGGGGPILLRNPNPGSPGIFIKNFAEGWLAFETRSGECDLEWKPAPRFIINGDESLQQCQDLKYNEIGCPLPPTTRTLRRFPTYIENNTLFVRLNAIAPEFCDGFTGS